MTVDAGWWDPKSGQSLHPSEREKARANSLINCARNLETVQQEVHTQNLMNSQIYSNRELACFDWGTGALHRASLSPVNRVGENLVLSVVETLVAQVGKQRPKAKPMTRGGSFRLRNQARLLDKFLYGEFVRLRIHEQGKRVFRDSLVYGFGCLYFTIGEDDRLIVERVFPDEILVDQMEVIACGKPLHYYRRRVLPIEVVAETWGVDEDDVKTAATFSDYLEYRAIGKGYCVVVEGWRVKQGSRDGYYCAAVNGMILDEKTYGQQTPPFVFYHWHPIEGFYSPSAVEQALPYQIRLNEVNDVIRDAQDIMARPRLLVAEGSRVNPFEIDNMIARIIKYTGIKPEVANWPAVQSELYNERDRCWYQCRDQFGLGNNATSGGLPANARYDSSAAVQEANLVQDDRLADPSQRLERFYLDVAETMIRTIDHFGASPKTTWTTGGRRSGMVEVIEWDRIDIDEDSYVLQLEASSVLDQTPAAKRDSLEKQLALGLITPEDYRLELAHPDDAAELSLASAAAADIRRVIGLLEDGKYEHPEPLQDLVNGVEDVSLAYLNLSRFEDDDPDHSLEEIKSNFRDWIVAARGILDDGAEDDEPMGEGMPPVDPMTGMPMDPAMAGGAPPMGGLPGQPLPPGPDMIPVPEAAGLASHVDHHTL